MSQDALLEEAHAYATAHPGTKVLVVDGRVATVFGEVSDEQAAEHVRDMSRLLDPL